MRRSSIVAIAAALIAIPSVGTPAQAAFSKEQQKCRGTVAKNGGKLAKAINKTLVSCHKDRSSEGSAIDCNFISGNSDPKGKILKAENKLRDAVGGAKDKCAPAGVPADVGYTSCPSPCTSAVPAIAGFGDVAECIICLTRSSAESLRLDGQGSPIVPLNPAEATCHGDLGRNQTKLFDTVIKERSKCQKKADKNGEMDTTSCEGIDPKQKLAKTRGKGEDKITSGCSAPVDLLELDSCSDSSVNSLITCLFDDASSRGEALFRQFYGVVSNVTTTTTTNITTTTTIGGPTTTTTTLSGSQDPQCPDFATLRLFAGVSNDACATNADCTAASNPGSCDTGIGLCVTNSNLDTGWTGFAHNADVLQDSFISAELFCDGPAPTCGQCNVAGVSPDPGNCRCSNATRTQCSDPIGFDPVGCGTGLACTVDSDCKRCTGDDSVICSNDGDCSGVGGICLGGSPTLPCNTSTGMCEGTCNCYLGSLLPLNSANVAACVLNKLSQDITGTVNVDTGESDLTVRMRSIVYLGTERYKTFGPCPVCGGTCTAGKPGTTTCVIDLDCDTSIGAADGVCGNFDPIAGDGLRGGTCVEGPSDGLSCDIDALSTTFPAFPGQIGGGVSLDCLPENGKNISGTGLRIALDPGTGSKSLTAAVDCGVPASFPPFGPPHDCHCRTCSSTVGGDKIPCSSDADCSSIGAGTCSSNQGGEATFPNQCSKEPADGGDDFIGLCVDADPGNPGIVGECNSAADDINFCDGALRANGEPFIPCDANADCVVSGLEHIPVGNCTLTRRRPCFLDTINVSGIPDPTAPTQAALFCIPPTINSGINGVAGLPGPGRLLLQGTNEYRCNGDPGSTYTPGVGGCP